MLQYFQQTICTPISCQGVGVHSGLGVQVAFLPAPANHGIIFRRVDITDQPNEIPARWDFVSDTKLSTTISTKNGVVVQTIEHVMAALAGMGIDNIVIEINGPEMAIMDGSSAIFIDMIEKARIQIQQTPRTYLKIQRTLVIQEGAQEIILKPADHFKAHYDFDFHGRNNMPPQTFKLSCLSTEFKDKVARARTFGFYSDVERLRAAGYARGGSLENAVVMDGDEILNTEGFRYPEECARHKLLDAIGDMYLAGHPIIGEFYGRYGGHALNHKALETLFKDPRNYSMEQLVPAPDTVTSPSNFQLHNAGYACQQGFVPA